jgi:ATP-dependent Lon protease
MEIIEENGYTLEEKVEIAARHLNHKQIKENGIQKDQILFKRPILKQIIEEYTNESGVRGLDKVIAKLVRNRTRQIAMEESYELTLTSDILFDVLGAGRSKIKNIDHKTLGVVTGLAWTSIGGDVLFIESSITKGKGKLTLTGNLGDVMKESAIIALEYLKAHADTIALTQTEFDTHNVHIHVPEGATPKDGPSAGITMLTSLASIFAKKKVKKNLAMTGEITLRGDVLPVGGIKEKILAAKRSGVKDIILCHKNKQDIDEIKASYLNG